MIVSPHTPRSVRPGLSLVEVLMSLTIFLLSLVALSRLIEMGADRARDLQYLSVAAMIAQSNMDKVVAGIMPLAGQGETTSEEDPDWLCAVEAQAEPTPGLYFVTVIVSRNRIDGTRFEWRLPQYVLDPTLRGSTTGTNIDIDAPATDPATTDPPTTGGGTTGGGGGG